MGRTFLFIVGAMVTLPLAYVLFEGIEESTRLASSVILAAGVGVTGALIFGKARRKS